MAYLNSPLYKIERSRDPISANDWKVLYKHRDMYKHAPPKLDMPTYSIHVDWGVHVSYCSTQHVAVLQVSALALISSQN